MGEPVAFNQLGRKGQSRAFPTVRVIVDEKT